MSVLPRAALGERALFSQLCARAYLAWSAVAPLSDVVRATAREVLDAYAREGLGAIRRELARRERARDVVAALIGGDARGIAIAPSTTRGVIDVALSIPWRAGDRVICFRGEFPTNVTPWQRAAETFGLEVVMLDVRDYEDPSGVALERLATELRRGARLVAVSAVQFQTGLRMPLREMAALAHAHGAELFTDAIQAAGVVPLDVRADGVDYLVTGSHKWLGAPEGVGFVWMAEPAASRLVPRVAGWLSHEDALDFLFEGRGLLRYDKPIRRRADYLEGGAQNAIGIACLEASASVLLELGVPAIYAHVQAVHDALEPVVTARGFESRRARDRAQRSGILAFDPPAGVDLRALVARLAARGVVATNPDGHLRLAPHWPSSASEAAIVADALDDALSSPAG